MKADKSEAIRKRLDNARVDVELRRLKIRQLDAARTEEMKTFISVKLELAAQQRKLLELKAINARMQKVRSPYLNAFISINVFSNYRQPK